MIETRGNSATGFWGNNYGNLANTTSEPILKEVVPCENTHTLPC